jgi:hypothetical protein
MNFLYLDSSTSRRSSIKIHDNFRHIIAKIQWRLYKHRNILMLYSSIISDHTIEQTYSKLYGAMIHCLSSNRCISWPMCVDTRFLFSSVSFCCAFYIAVACFLLLMPLNVSLFSFISGLNSNWFICVGFTNLSLFLSSHICIKLHMKTESLDF